MNKNRLLTNNKKYMCLEHIVNFMNLWLNKEFILLKISMNSLSIYTVFA